MCLARGLAPNKLKLPELNIHVPKFKSVDEDGNIRIQLFEKWSCRSNPDYKMEYIISPKGTRVFKMMTTVRSVAIVV